MCILIWGIRELSGRKKNSDVATCLFSALSKFLEKKTNLGCKGLDTSQGYRAVIL